MNQKCTTHGDMHSVTNVLHAQPQHSPTQTIASRYNQYMKNNPWSACVCAHASAFRTLWRAEHVATMDANGQWRAHDAGAPMHRMQTLHPQIRVTIPTFGTLALPWPKVHQGRNTQTGRKVRQPGQERRCTDRTQTYTWRITTPYAIACYLSDASTRNTGAERGADLTSIASYAARRLAPVRAAQCPEHITPATSYTRSSPRTPPTSTPNPLIPPPSHASPHMDPTRTQARPSPTQATRSHDPGHPSSTSTDTGSPQPDTLHKDFLTLFICSKHG